MFYGDVVMKKLVCVLFCLSLTLTFGCSKTDSTENSKVTWVAWETDETSESTVPFTVPLTPEESQSSYEASVIEESSLNEVRARIEAVNSVIRSLVDSKEFKEAETDEQKAEIVINVLKELSEHGTAEYPVPLVVPDSWVFYPEQQEVVAEFIDGGQFSVDWYDYNAASTDVTW